MTKCKNKCTVNYTQTYTKNNKTRALLQTTGGKDERITFLCGNHIRHHRTHVKVHKYKKTVNSLQNKGQRRTENSFMRKTQHNTIQHGTKYMKSDYMTNTSLTKNRG